MNRTLRIPLRGACVALVVFLAPSTGARADTGLVAVGAGTATCAVMYKQSTERSDGRTKVGAVFLSWFQGFLSGMNVANVAHVSRREPVDVGPADLRALVEGHCDESPEADLLTVVVKIYYQLSRSSGQ